MPRKLHTDTAKRAADPCGDVGVLDGRLTAAAWVIVGKHRLCRTRKEGIFGQKTARNIRLSDTARSDRFGGNVPPRPIKEQEKNALGRQGTEIVGKIPAKGIGIGRRWYRTLGGTVGVGFSHEGKERRKAIVKPLAPMAP